MQKLLFTRPIKIACALLLVISCKTEKDLPRTANPEDTKRIKQEFGVDIASQGLFSETSEYHKNAAIFASEPTEAERQAARQKMQQEINLYQLPRTVEQVLQQFPRWEDFQQQYSEKKALLSSRTNQFLSKNLLWAYDFYKQPYNAATATIAIQHLQYLADKQYRDYRLFYQYLIWLKQNNQVATAGNLQKTILTYAKTAPQTAVPNTAQTRNAQTAAEINRYAGAQAEQQQFLERIRQL